MDQMNELPPQPLGSERSPEVVRLLPSWRKFAVKLGEFGVGGEEINRFEREFNTSFETVAKLNNGENILGDDFHFEKNNLRYHSFVHTVRVVERSLQMLPGFLAELKKRGIEPATNLSKIKELLYAAMFHEIGYLKRVKGDEAYQTQGELYFDHVDRGMNLAPAILQRIGLDLRGDEIVFLKQMIRTTDFNMSLQDKEKEGLIGETQEWGQILWAADFLSNFAHPESIPQIVSGLYWENLSRAVKEGKVYAWKRNPDGTLVKELVESNDPLNDYVRICDVKFAGSASSIGDYEVKPQNFFEFVASNFSTGMEGALKKYIDYADVWEWNDHVNEIRRNYQLNNERIKLLQEAINIPNTDRFSVFEGAFTGHDLRMWTEELKREHLIDQGYKPGESWYSIDKRVLGTEGAEGVLSRLATANLREILAKVEEGRRSEAVALLLGRYREKLAGENVKDVHLFLSPKAYLVEEGGPFADTDQAIDIFSQAFSMVNGKEQKGCPTLHFGVTVRREKDFLTDGRLDTEKMRALARSINRAYTAGKIKNLAFLGLEQVPLKEFAGFFNELEEELPLIVLVGQRLPEVKQIKDRRGIELLENAQYISEIAGRFKDMMLWGLHDLDALSPQDMEQLRQILPNEVKLLLTLTFDQLTGLVKEGDHPLKRLMEIKPGAEIKFGTGNGALTYGSSSVTLDAFIHYSKISGLPLRNILFMIEKN